MRHKYAEMIKAKADNMELVLFTKRGESSTWGELNNHGDVTFLYDFDYFLCLPKHKEAVLRGLNGEIAESTNENREGWSESSVESWDKDWWYMCDNYVSRTKPKKEKRLIGYRDDVVYGPYLSIDDINADLVLTCQVIEIEVEV